MLSKVQRQFLVDLQSGDLKGYSAGYRRKLKHQILKKKELLANDAKLVQEALPKLIQVR